MGGGREGRKGKGGGGREEKVSSVNEHDTVGEWVDG